MRTGGFREYDLFGADSVHLCKATDADLARLKEMYEIRDLFIYESPVTDDALKHLAVLNDLEELSLVVTDITDAGLVHLQALQLRELTLNRNERITGRAVGHLRPIRTLKRLRMGLCPRVSDEGISDIQELIGLEELELGQTAITDASIPYLSTLHNLRRVNIGQTNVTKEGAARLRKALPRVGEYDFAYY
jgi:hypothetical protein